MKKILLYMCVAVVAMACAKDDNNITTPAESKAPATIYASIVGDSRVELQWENATTPKTYWSVGDAISIIDCNDRYEHNLKYVNNGTEATRHTEFSYERRDGDDSQDSAFPSDERNTKNIAVYPFSERSPRSGRNCINVFLTPTQTFVGSNTYCPNANIMVATAEPGSNNYSFKNMLGYLRVTLKGDATITDITLQGNNNEYLTGYFCIDCNGEEPTTELVEDDSRPKYITIDCGEGVELNNEDGISFIFVVPPQTFAEGFTITATNSEGKKFQKETTKSISIEPNRITDMPAISDVYDSKFIVCTTITYTAKEKVKPSDVEYATYLDFESTFDYETDETGQGTMVFFGWREYDTKVKFTGNQNLTSIVIPDNIRTIPDNTFNGCTNLKEVTLPNYEDLIIGKYAFCGCTSLKEVNIQNIIMYIDDYAFKGCTSLESIDISKVWQYICTGAFEDCTSLKTVFCNRNNPAYIFHSKINYDTLEVTVTYYDPFKGCTALEHIYVPESMVVTYKSETLEEGGGWHIYAEKIQGYNFGS